MGPGAVTGAEWAAEVRGGAVDARAAGPTVVFDVVLMRPGLVHAIVLQARVLIDAAARRYTAEEQGRLLELFGRRPEWRDNLRAVAWADVAVAVPAFEGSATVALRVPCTYDMEVASAKYFHGVDGADVALRFLFSGTAFVPGLSGVAAVRLPRDLEASWRMPAPLWHEMMGTYFPDWRWARFSPSRFEALTRYKATRALPTWDAVVDDLLAQAVAPAGRSPA